MTATNHALTGALLGLGIAHPVALPLAFLSHFVLDSLPHFGFNDLNARGASFKIFLLIDATLCGGLVLLLAIARPEAWVLACFTAFLAASPDFMWAPGFFRTQKGLPEHNGMNRIMTFHSKVQWYQKPPGAMIEALWAATCGLLILKLLA